MQHEHTLHILTCTDMLYSKSGIYAFSPNRMRPYSRLNKKEVDIMEKSNKKQNCKDYILQILEEFEDMLDFDVVEHEYKRLLEYYYYLNSDE